MIQRPDSVADDALRGQLPRADEREVAIIMLTWNALEYTKNCIAELRSVTSKPAYRLIVVDNGSHDGTVEWLQAQPDIALHLNSSNEGFTKGVNQGLALTRPHEDVVVLNNDIELVDEDWLIELQRVAYNEPDVGVVGARLIDGLGRINHLGSYMSPRAMYGHQMGGLETDINQGLAVRDVESVIFALAYITRRCLELVGNLDEDLFAYYEDTDFCLRAGRAGLKVKYTGAVTSVHFHNTSTIENKVDFFSIYGKSRTTFGRKWSKWLDHERYDTEVTWHSVLSRPLGYAVSSRYLMRGLDANGSRVSYVNAYSDVDGPVDEDRLIQDIVSRPLPANAVQVAYCQADAFTRVKGKRRVGISMLEVTGLPDDWVAGCNYMDEIWVPASFNVETFRNSGVTTDIRVMPLGVDTDYFHPEIRGWRPSKKFTYLSVFEWGERKAPETLLKAWANEFGPDEDVLLLLSVFNYDPEVDVELEIAKLVPGRTAPIVVMVNPEFSGYQMGSLYRSADCFVLPTRGEGWGMPVMEAMACGLPTIATGWGGVADFLTEDTGYPIEFSMIPAIARCPFYEGFEWSDPSVDHLQARMREVLDDPTSAAVKTERAVRTIQRDYTWHTATRRMADRIREIS